MWRCLRVSRAEVVFAGAVWFTGRARMWNPKRAAAAAVLEEYEDSKYEDSEAGQSSTTESMEMEPAPISQTAQTRSIVRRIYSQLTSLVSRGGTSSEEKDKLMKRARPRPRRAVQRQATITMPTDVLLQSLAQKLTSAGAPTLEAEMTELTALLRRQLRHELHESSLWLLDAFDLLSSEASSGDSPLLARRSADHLDGLSDRFIDDLCALMQRANFRLFSQREWAFAQQENFMFTLPVTPAWESLDSTMISRLFVRHPHLGLQGAQLARRVLLFHRGSGHVTKTSCFLEEKLDMLLDRLFTDPFRRIWSLVHTLVCPGAALRAAIAAEELAAEVELNSAMKEDAHRVSFDRSLPSICSLFRRMLQRLTLKEPTFQEAVVIYSEITSMVDHEIESYGGVVPMRQRLSDDQADSSGPERPVLRLKSFRDIPIADVEVVLPGLKVDRMKSADIVKLAIILLAGIATAIYSYVFATIGGWTVRATLIGLLLLRAFQTWRSLVLAKLTMDDFIRTTLYCRSQDSQRGVLLSILNSIERHEHRETLTLYLLMRHHLISQSTDPAAAGVSGGIPATGGISASEAELMCSEFLR